MGEQTYRIVILMDRYLPILGGAQNNIHELGRYLGRAGFQVSVLTRRVTKELPTKEVIDGITVYRFAYFQNRIVSKTLCCIEIIRWLVRCRAAFDMVLCVPCVYQTDLLPVFFASQRTRFPFVVRTTVSRAFDFMLTWSVQSYEEFLKKILNPPLLSQWILRHADAIVTQTSLLREKGERFGVNNCRVIPSGVNTKRFSIPQLEEKEALRRKLSVPKGKTVVINIGRYVYEKNQKTLIQAAEQIERFLYPGQLHVLILGATEEGQVTSNEKDLKTYVENHGLSDLVTFFDDVRNVEEYLRLSDIFVFSSFFDEGMSNAMLEAMAVGLPMICSDIPRVTHVLPQDVGLRFSPTDVEALCRHLITLLNDPKLGKRHGELLASHVQKHYSSQKSGERYASLFREILEKSS